MRTTTSVSFYAFGILVAFIVAIGSLPSSAGNIRHDRKAEDYHKLGQNADFDCVVRVGVKPLGQPNISFSGNGVLIAPRWILTAGHVSTAAPLKRLRFQIGDEIYRAQRLVPHPDFLNEKHDPSERKEATFGESDLSLIQLDRSVTSLPQATRYRGEDEIGKTLTIVGNGASADGKAGLKRPITLERRGFNNVLDAAGGKLGDLKLTNHVLLFDFDDPDNPSGNQLGDASPLELEGAISKGDSGGGWFINDDGAWKLVAITSRRLPPSGDLNADWNRAELYYGAIGVGMRISSANEWIDLVIDAE